VYDADGNRVLGTVAGVTTAYVNGLYEWHPSASSGGATTKYYEGGAMRRTGYAANNGISYVLGDQLGSSSKIVGQNGVLQASNYFLPFGGNRGGSAFSDLTTKRFTGQYQTSYCTVFMSVWNIQSDSPVCDELGLVDGRPANLRSQSWSVDHHQQRCLRRQRQASVVPVAGGSASASKPQRSATMLAIQAQLHNVAGVPRS
jgi:hypothetical protein